jgi:putative ABC transport system ATP-binding protein
VRRIPSDIQERADVVMQQLGLRDLANKPARLLSGGEMQRVAIARALIHRPRLLAADEPTGNLDQASAVQLMELLAELNRSGLTILLVTHNPDLLRYCTRHLNYDQGTFIEQPLPEAVTCAS